MLAGVGLINQKSYFFKSFFLPSIRGIDQLDLV